MEVNCATSAKSPPIHFIKNGGVEEILWEMEFVRMIEKRVCIEGRWCKLYFFKEESSIRVEVEQEVSGKRHKVFPDNNITFMENENGKN